MAIKIGANLAYNGKLPNFERDSFKTKAAMKAFNENSIDEGHLSYCEEDGNIYQYKSANAVDTTIGRWRIFKTDIVVDAALNEHSKNPVQNKAIANILLPKPQTFDIFANYQPRSGADYVATGNINYENLSEYARTGVVDLNGFAMIISTPTNIKNKTFCNGTINIDDNVTINACYFYNITIKTGKTSITYEDNESYYYNCIINNLFSSHHVSFYYCDVNNAIFQNASLDCGYSIFNSCEFNEYPANSEIESSVGNYIIIDTEFYTKAIIKNGSLTEAGFESDITNPTISGNAPSCEAVKDALQLKADKTQLNNLATKTELNGKADASALNNYVTTATANTTYATKVSLNNEVNQLVEEINLKLDDTVAASTYLRKDDANTTYAKKSDISNVYKFKGTKTNYSELPTTGVVTGDVWNITNADAEHGIKAGDNVAWNGTGWDNLSGVTDLSAYATTTTTDAMSADIKKLMDKAFPFTVKVSLDKTLAKKGTSQPVKVTITPKIGDDNVDADEIMINGAEYHGATPYVYSATATATTTYNVRVRKDDRTAQGSATITFVNPSYDGAVAANFTATEASIKALTETLRSGKGGTRTFNLNNQKACIAYPKAFGAATGIKDANGFDYLASYTRSELNVNGELYYVYLLTNATTITDMKQTIS